MKRYHSESAIIRRHHREHLRSVHGWPSDLQAGRFRKKDAYDCGQALCRICHYNKWLLNGGHELSRQEEKSNLDFSEQLKDNLGR